MVDKRRLKTYLYYLLGVVLFSYGLMMLTAEDMELIAFEWNIYLSLVYLGGLFAYNQKITLLKQGKKILFILFLW